MSGEKKRSFRIERLGGGTSSSHRLHFLQDDKEVGFQDFDGDGTNNGDIEAQQQAQNKADTWVALGER